VRERREKAHGPYRKRNSWRVIIVAANGSRCTETFASEAAATARIAEFEREFTSRTIRVAVDAYVAAQDRRVIEGEIRAVTIEREGYHLRKMLKLKEHGQLDLRKLTPKLAAKLYDERAGAVDSHRNGLNVVKAFAGWCVEQGWLAANPFVAVKGKGRRRRGKPQLRIEEARRFMAACVELAPTDEGAVLALAYLLLGARAGEVVLRVVRDVDDGGRMLWIPDSKTDAGRRQLEVPDVLVPHFQRLTARRPAMAKLFAGAAHRARAQDWAREQVTRICKAAGVPRVTPHGLRGTAATIAKEAGATSQLVAATLGHASSAITDAAYIDRSRAETAARRTTLRVLEGGRR
jgi:integrase